VSEGVSGDVAGEVFRVFDKDRDGLLSPQEYGEFVSMSFAGQDDGDRARLAGGGGGGRHGRGEEKKEKEKEKKEKEKEKEEKEKEKKEMEEEYIGPDEEVEVIDRNGKKKIMKKKDFDLLNHQKMKGLSMEEGEMTKVEEGETTVEKAREENPDLARVLAIGEWIQDQLADMDYAKGKMLNMKTLDSRVDGMDGQQKLKESQDFHVSFFLLSYIMYYVNAYCHNLKCICVHVPFR
jgi:hypothetical protein